MNKAYDVYSTINNENKEEVIKKSATILRTASGIIEYIQTRELPRWTELPSDRPIEINASICQCLQDYCILTSQALTVRKGIESGTSKQTLAKLTMDIWNKSITMDKTFKSFNKDIVKDLNLSWKSYLQVQQNYSKSYVFKYMGEQSYSDSKFGLAVSYLNVASDSLKSITPSIIKDLSIYKKLIDDAKDDIEHVKRSFVNENNHIYYQVFIYLVNCFLLIFM